MRLRVKNQCIFGTYAGMTDDGKRVKFYDDELGKIVLYPRDKVVLAHDKGI